MIALKNSSGSNLAQLIIGNEVEGLGNTYFVRKPNQTKFIELRFKMSTMSVPNSWIGSKKTS